MTNGNEPGPGLPDGPAEPRVLEELAEKGLISPACRDEALRLLTPPRSWWLWTERSMLILGAVLGLAGLVFFFAHNWAAMAAWQKFAVIEAALLLAAAAAWFTGLGTLSGKVALLAACLLTGLLLAVYGQVYQTGADAYQLFTAWALLTVGWVLIGRFAPLWVLWLGIVSFALGLYWDQVAVPNGTSNLGVLCILLGALYALALAGRELGHRSNIEWLRASWLRWLLLAAALYALADPAIQFITERSERTAANGIAAILLLAAIAAGYRYFRFGVRDLFSLFLCLGCLTIVLLTLVGKVMFEISKHFFIYLLFGLVVMAAASAVAWWLWSIGKNWGGAAND